MLAFSNKSDTIKKKPNTIYIKFTLIYTVTLTEILKYLKKKNKRNENQRRDKTSVF